MDLLKNVRVIVVLLLILVFAYFLISPYFLKKSGVIVVSVDKDSKCGVIKEGDVITNVLGSYIRNSEEFKTIEKNAKSNEYTNMVVNDGPGGCVAIRDGYFGLAVADVPSDKVKFGIDIEGGITTTLKTKESLNKTRMESVAKILKNRIGIYVLPETTALVSGNFLKINSLSTEKISQLISKGKFEAKVLEEVKLQDNVGKIPVGVGSYPIELVNNTLKINNTSYKEGDAFQLEDIKFDVKNITNTSVVVEALVFENKDILGVLTGVSTSYNSNAQAYEVVVPVQLSTDATNRFSKVIKKIPTTLVGTQIVLNAFLAYYLDGSLISQLNIPMDLVRQPVTQLSIVSFSSSMPSVSNTKLKILSAVEAGALPTDLEIVQTERYEPALKTFSTEVFAFGLGLFVVFVVLVFHLRYKKLKFGLLTVTLAFTEILLVLGTIAVLQQVFGTNWVINLTTIVGFLAVSFASSALMIVSTEQALKKKICRSLTNIRN